MPRNNNLPPNPNRPGWIPYAAAGLAALAVAMAGYVAAARDGNKVSGEALPAPDARVPATASQYPGSPTPAITTPDVITTSTAPTPVETTPSATATTTPNKPPKPVDPLAARRLAAAHRYASCRLDSFTNDGVTGKSVTLDLDLSFDRDPVSEAARATGRSPQLTWNTPQIVLYGIGPNGMPTGKRIDKIHEGPAGDVDPTLTSVPVPAHIAKNSAYAVVVETSATSVAPEGGHNRTTVDEVCGATQNQGGTEWRPYELDLDGLTLPPRTVHLPR
jgi:hypothetical protein